MCWGGGVPGRRGRSSRPVLGGVGVRQARLAGHHVEGVVRRSGEASQAIMCIVRISYHLVSSIFFPLLLEECDITGAVGHTPSPGPIG